MHSYLYKNLFDTKHTSLLERDRGEREREMGGRGAAARLGIKEIWDCALNVVSTR